MKAYTFCNSILTGSTTGGCKSVYLLKYTDKSINIVIIYVVKKSLICRFYFNFTTLNILFINLFIYEKINS